jgi:uncharacterized protein
LGFGCIYGLLTIFTSASIGVTDLEKVFQGEDRQLMKPILAITHITTFIVPALIYNHYILNSQNHKHILFDLTIDWKMVFIGLIFLYSCYPLGGMITHLISHLELPLVLQNMSEQNQGMIEKIIGSSNVLELIITIIVMAVIPSIGEELLFRGVIQNILSNHINIKLAIFITSLIFAILHLDPVGIAFKLILGCGLGIIYYFSKNILVPIIIHCLNNAFPILAYYFSSNADADKIENSNTQIILIGLVFLPLTYFLFIKMKKQSVNG